MPVLISFGCMSRRGTAASCGLSVWPTEEPTFSSVNGSALVAAAGCHSPKPFRTESWSFTVLLWTPHPLLPKPHSNPTQTGWATGQDPSGLCQGKAGTQVILSTSGDSTEYLFS
jgi:hypothetical protein